MLIIVSSSWQVVLIAADSSSWLLQANVLTLDAQLGPDSTELLAQLPPTNSSAVQAAFTVSGVAVPTFLSVENHVLSEVAAWHWDLLHKLGPSHNWRSRPAGTTAARASSRTRMYSQFGEA